ncbi:MAG: M20 family metallopeptidase, partial [Ruthenibacterium sp.]
LVLCLTGQHAESYVFAGHLDTVACGEASLWHSDPLSASLEGDILTARGAADMKGGITAMLLTLDYLVQQHITPQSTLYFCFTADEEASGTGACAIAASGILQKVQGVFICEPSDGKIGICEKGALWMRATASGRACHASRPELGANAIEALILFLAKAHALFNFAPHPLLGPATLAVTKMSGGVMTNIVPASAEAELDLRLPPDTDFKAVLACLQSAATAAQAESDVSILLETLNERAALSVREDDPFVLSVMAAMRRFGLMPICRGILFFTDGTFLLPELHAPFVILGPGDDRECHKADEHASIHAVTAFAMLYTGFILGE